MNDPCLLNSRVYSNLTTETFTKVRVYKSRFLLLQVDSSIRAQQIYYTKGLTSSYVTRTSPAEAQVWKWAWLSDKVTVVASDSEHITMTTPCSAIGRHHASGTSLNIFITFQDPAMFRICFLTQISFQKKKYCVIPFLLQFRINHNNDLICDVILINWKEWHDTKEWWVNYSNAVNYSIDPNWANKSES